MERPKKECLAVPVMARLARSMLSFSIDPNCHYHPWPALRKCAMGLAEESYLFAEP